MNYGNKIAELRSINHMSQKILAERLFVSRDLISKWENNKRRPDFQTLKQLSILFHVEIDYFEPESKMLINELSKCISKNSNINLEDLPDMLNIFLKSLSERDASVFIRRYYFMETPSEIGWKYAINDVYIRVILSRTRNKLKKYLEKGGQIYE